jgi:hypothetical protein
VTQNKTSCTLESFSFVLVNWWNPKGKPFALSDHEIGQHIPSGGANDDDRDDGDGHGDDQVLGLEK